MKIFNNKNSANVDNCDIFVKVVLPFQFLLSTLMILHFQHIQESEIMSVQVSSFQPFSFPQVVRNSCPQNLFNN